MQKAETAKLYQMQLSLNKSEVYQNGQNILLEKDSENDVHCLPALKVSGNDYSKHHENYTFHANFLFKSFAFTSYIKKTNVIFLQHM